VLPPSVLLGMGATALAMRDGFLPIRRPSVNQPPFFSLPLNLTRTRIIPKNTPNWTVALAVPSREQYVPVINAYSLGINRSLVNSGVEFRFQFNGGDLPEVDLLTDAELCRDGSWPLYRKTFFQVVPFGQRFTVEVRNLSFTNHIYLIGLFGYYYPSVDPTTYTKEGRRG
jgi:hypothetical protein